MIYQIYIHILCWHRNVNIVAGYDVQYNKDTTVLALYDTYRSLCSLQTTKDTTQTSTLVLSWLWSVAVS